MKRKRDGPTVTAGLVLGREDVGAIAVVNPVGALGGPPLDCQSVGLFDLVQDAMDHVIPLLPVSRRRSCQPVPLRVPPREPLHARRLPPILEKVMPCAGPSVFPVPCCADGLWTSTPLGPTAKSDREEWQWLLRLVSLSGLGWAFVLVAVLWESFAVALSRCAGSGWDKGAFFFVWGLGILALGFYLRASRKRPAVSRLFLGVNILVVSVLSLVVATR
jgi:hypothetical protein